MRLSEWRAKAPVKDAVSPKVIAVVESALATLGADADPECWVVWGDDPAVRYLLLAPTPGGLAPGQRPGERPGRGSPGRRPRSSAGTGSSSASSAVEIQGGHRLVTFQAEAQVLTGVDDAADAIAAFAQALFAAVDGRAGSFATRRRPGQGGHGATGRRLSPPVRPAGEAHDRSKGS